MIYKDLILNGYGVARVEKHGTRFDFFIISDDMECYIQVDHEAFLDYLEKLKSVYLGCKEILEFINFLTILF